MAFVPSCDNCGASNENMKNTKKGYRCLVCGSEVKRGRRR